MRTLKKVMESFYSHITRNDQFKNGPFEWGKCLVWLQAKYFSLQAKLSFYFGNAQMLEIQNSEIYFLMS